MPANEELVSFPGAQGPLLGMWHAAVPSARGAFLFCHPFAEEKKCSHRAFVHMARALAAAGYYVLRFDFSGCGDSAGDFAAATCEAWQQDILAAAELLRARAPGMDVGLFGLRLGATLACTASGSLAPKWAILWEPILEGEAYFRESLRRVLIKQMMIDGRSRTRRDELLRQLQQGEGWVDLDGFCLRGTLYRGLSALRLASLGPPARRALLLRIAPRPTIGAELEQLAAGWRGAGAEVVTRAIAAPAIWNRLELDDVSPLVAATMSWLREAS